jgi:hypothetical protein
VKKLEKCESRKKLHAIGWEDGRKWLEHECMRLREHKGEHTDGILYWRNNEGCDCSDCRKRVGLDNEG